MSSIKGGGGSAASLKQGNLFSFFAKKKPAAAPAGGSAGASAGSAGNDVAAAAASAGPSASSSSSKANASANNNNNAANANSNSNNSATNKTNDGEVTASRATNPRGAVSSKQAALLAKVHVGCTVAVYWPDDAEYYPAKVRWHCVDIALIKWFYFSVLQENCQLLVLSAHYHAASYWAQCSAAFYCTSMRLQLFQFGIDVCPCLIFHYPI